jgi:hypothetical protein
MTNAAPDTEYATEQRCARCGEWLPADEEFFRTMPHGRLQSWCRLCESAARGASGVKRG